MRLVLYFQCQNKALEDFLACSEELVAHLEKKNFEVLKDYELKREGLLRSFALFEERAKNLTVDQQKLDSAVMNEIWRIHNERKRLMKAIEVADQRLNTLIEGEQGQLKRQMLELQQQRDKFSKFKSGMTPTSGTGLDQSL